MKLKVLQNTTFKQSTEDSSKLSQQDKVNVEAGRVFEIHSWKQVGKGHLKVALLKDKLGDPPRNTWNVFIPHIQLISNEGKVLSLGWQLPRLPFPTGRILPAKKLNVPYESQLDNELNPTGACNVTSYAMVMAYLQVKGRTNIAQLEDELYEYMERSGLSRWEPQDLARMGRAYGLKVDLTLQGNLNDIRKAISEGRPCIIHGYFTSFGHILVVRGYDQKGFFVNDPYGEWSIYGYQNEASGEDLYYSNELIKAKCSPEGENFVWLHRLSKA